MEHVNYTTLTICELQTRVAQLEDAVRHLVRAEYCRSKMADHNITNDDFEYWKLNLQRALESANANPMVKEMKAIYEQAAHDPEPAEVNIEQ